VRTAKLLTSLAVGAALSAALPLSSGGCDGCDEFLECTSRPGLRYVACGKKQHEFNDGTSFESETPARDHCYCGALIDCVDGSNLYLCNFMTLDGTVVAYPPNNVELEMTTAVAGCLEYDGCAVENARCNFGGWYLNCGRKDGDRVYVTSGGQIYKSEVDAVETCVALGTPDQSFRCTSIIENCSELEDCSDSVACGEFCSTPICSFNENWGACIADPACKWSP
jgi:hypothetical protein